MPDDRLKRFGVGRDPRGRNRRNDNDVVTYPACISAVSPDNPKNTHSARAGFVETGDNIHRNISLSVAATDGKDENGIVRITSACPEISGKNCIPSLIVGPGSEFGNIVDGRIGFDSAQFPEIVHRMAAIRGAAANTDNKKPAATFPQFCQLRNHFLDLLRIEFLANPGGFFEIIGYVTSQRVCTSVHIDFSRRPAPLFPIATAARVNPCSQRKPEFLNPKIRGYTQYKI